MDKEVVYKLELLMKHSGVTPAIFPAVAAALEKEESTGAPAGAMVLPDGRVITGKTSDQIGASAALVKWAPQPFSLGSCFWARSAMGLVRALTHRAISTSSL